MIFTITLNPALDYVIRLADFTEGQVNRVVEEHIYYGGKGINVAVVLKELGFTSTALGFIAGFTGKELQRGCQEDLGLKTDFIEVKDGMTRINVKMHSQKETEINGLGPKVGPTDLQNLLDQLQGLQAGDVLIISGSIPSLMSQDTYKMILESLKGKSIDIVVDASGKLLLETLAYKPFLIKPNNHELGEMFNVELKTIEEIEYYARKLQDMGARNVLISMAKDGSLLIDEDGNAHHFGVYQGQVVNSVGAGDSMVAGFVAGYLSKLTYDETLRLATAAGGATAFSSSLATKEEIEELMKQK